MNETFAKVLEYTITFWIILALLSTLFASRMQTYILNDDATSTLSDSVNPNNLNLLTGITIIFDVMTFQLLESVPIWITYLLDLMFVLTGLSVVMALTDR